MSRPTFKISVSSPFDYVQNSNNVRTSTTTKNVDTQFTSSDRYNLDYLNPVNVDKYIKEEPIEENYSISEPQNPYSLYSNNLRTPILNYPNSNIGSSNQFQLPDVPPANSLPTKPVEQKPNLISRIFTLRNIIGFGLLAVPLFISK